MNKNHSDVAVLILQVCEDSVEGSAYCILYGTVASKSTLMRLQVGRDVVFNVLENQFLKALHQYWSERHKGSSHLEWTLQPFWYRDDGGCYGDSLLRE